MSVLVSIIRFCRRCGERWRQYLERIEEKQNGFPRVSVAECIRRIQG